MQQISVNQTANNSIDIGDFSNITFINDIWIVKPASFIIIESTIFAPVVIFGIFGNLLSIYVLIKNSHICTPTNLLIGNMALADLLSLLIHPWIFLMYDFFQNYQFGSFGCKTEATLECAILITSVFSVSSISYDRLMAILMPKESKLTKKGAKIVMILTWIIGFLISMPLFFYRNYKERQWKDFLEEYCTEDTFVTNIYWHVIITVLIWLPLTVQLICYIAIFVKLHKYEKVVSRKLDHRQIDYKKKAVRMMFAMILTFLICRLPFSALIFYRDQVHNSLSQVATVQNLASGAYHNFWLLSKFFIFLNCALNPVIYSVTNEKFQKGFNNTKVAKWIFPQSNAKPLILPKTTPKTAEQSTFFKISLFFIFKKKQKLNTTLTDVGTDTIIVRNDLVID